MLVFGKVIVVLDIDGDNDLDIYVGGNVVLGKYLLILKFFFLKNEGGKFVDIIFDN